MNETPEYKKWHANWMRMRNQILNPITPDPIVTKRKDGWHIWVCPQCGKTPANSQYLTLTREGAHAMGKTHCRNRHVPPGVEPLLETVKALTRPKNISNDWELKRKEEALATLAAHTTSPTTGVVE